MSFCESSWRLTAQNGIYLGKWQMSPDVWQTYGGLAFASRPDLASEAQQDYVAYGCFLARGWEPWDCRSAL